MVDAANHRSIIFDGQIINAQSHDVHLRHIICNNTRGLSVQKAKNDLIIKMNVLTSCFRHAYVDTKYRLFKAFCMSMYGCVLWDLQSNYVNIFITAWRKCIRRLYGLPSKTHNNLLGTICHDIPVEGQIHVRFLKLNHDNLLSRNPCAILSTQDSKYDAGNYVCSKYSINKSDFVSIVQSSHLREIVQKYYVCSTELAMSAGAINDFVTSGRIVIVRHSQVMNCAK